MKNEKNNEVFQSLAMVTQFGINMIVPIVACTLFGVWLGEGLGISWLALPCFAVGALAGMRNIYVLARRIYQPGKQDETAHRKSEDTDVKKTQ